MKGIYVIAALALTATMAQARIGWTEAECKAKYGLPKAAKAWTSSVSSTIYDPEGFQLFVWFYEGKAFYVEYEPKSSISITQAKELLKKNSDTEWKSAFSSDPKKELVFTTTTKDGRKLVGGFDLNSKGKVEKMEIGDAKLVREADDQKEREREKNAQREIDAL